MRRSAVAALLLPALLLVGCASEATPTDGPSDPTTDATESAEPTGTGEPTEPTTTSGSAGSAADLATLATIAVEGDPGAAPAVDFTPELTFEGTAVLVVSDGEGDEITAGQVLSAHYVAFGGDSTTSLGSTWDYGMTADIPLTDQTLPEILAALVGQRVGARAIVGMPGSPEGTDEANAYPAQILVLEILGARTVLERAEGEAVTPPAGLPEVTLGADGAPSIEVPADAVEPTELVVQQLIQGDGAAIEVGSTVTFHYSGWLWDGTSFDSSWANGAPFTTQVGVGGLITGWDTGLIGQQVGSQVLLVIPSDQGYGPDGTGTIPGGATLIFVVDVLDVS